jgi:hypothetical protein
MYTPLTYRHYWRIVWEMLEFIETAIFTKRITTHMDDETPRQLQIELVLEPEKGSLIKGGGGLRKIRVADKNRGKGKRGGLRVIYYLRQHEEIAYLVFVYSKNDAEDLTPKEIKVLRSLVEED